MSPHQQVGQINPIAHWLLHRHFWTPELPLVCDGALRRRQSLSFPDLPLTGTCVFFLTVHTHFFFVIPLSMWDFIYSFIWLHWVSVTALRILVQEEPPQ